jgi:hypothetical protein
MVTHTSITFICSVAESNAANCWARPTKEATSPQLQFRQKLAQQMLMNRINDDGVRRQSPLRVRKRGRDDRVLDHGLVARPNFTGGWSNSLKTWTSVNTMYAKTKCATCKTKVRTYCKCDKKVCMCSVCYGDHMVAVHNTN